ncbi:nuclease-related domain-containing protein [Streptomyces sp. NPDC000229]|uniref:nuclease-related domain-containing protein n=1 Tax=Streptomyces sp. NPDC000229 TaxID=3154247 RepID=UPI00331772DE
MANLKVVRWNRYGHERLYANLPEGTAVAWADCKTGMITILRDDYRDAVLAVLTQHLRQISPTLPATPAPVRATASLPPLTPRDDLAANLPGTAVRAKLDEVGPGPLERFIAWVLRRPTDGDSWRTGLIGERRVGAELSRLERQGWRVLHSIPLPRGVDIDHLLIGPGGVFSVNTKHHPNKAVWVGDDVVRINRGKPKPYPRKSRSEAERVRRVLERYCDFPVPVEPVLVFVGATDVKVAATQLTVRVYREREVSALAPLPAVLTPIQAEQIYNVARHREAWLTA